MVNYRIKNGSLSVLNKFRAECWVEFIAMVDCMRPKPRHYLCSEQASCVGARHLKVWPIFQQTSLKPLINTRHRDVT